MDRFVGSLATVATVVAWAGLLPVSTNEALAISRYESRSMSCSSVRATVRAEGAVIMRWRSDRNPSIPLYGRFVANVGYCMPHQIAQIRYIPAADTKSCGVYECRTDNTDDDLFELLVPHRRR